MTRPPRFEAHRWLGDKRNMRVHDLDNVTEPCAIDDLLSSEKFLTFGPDVLPEARNRGFHGCAECVTKTATE